MFRNKKNLISLVLVAMFFTLPFFANAATPTIQNVIGNIQTGQTLTISGASMVNDDRSTWMTSPVNLQSGNAYGFEGASDQNDGYCSAGNCDGNYSTNVKLMGNQSIDFHAAGASGANDGGQNLPAQNADPRFVQVNSMLFTTTNYYGRFYVRYDMADNAWPSFELKMSSTQSGSGQVYVNVDGLVGYPSIPISNNPPTSIRIVDPTGYQANAGTMPGGHWVSGRWYCVEWRIQTGSPNAVTVWVDGNQTAQTTWTGSWSPIFYVFGPINGGATPANFDMHNYFDAMAFKTSSRVYPSSIIEISGDNGATWKYQPPTLLSDASIVIQQELPTLSAANYLLRMTNNLQQTSATYNLSGSVDVIAPSAPLGLNVL